MVCNNNNPGILDFQDAMHGAITYDLVSLLRDCYIAWPTSQVYAWLQQHYQRLQTANFGVTDFDTFTRWFDLMGIQRHLKAIGIFARLNYRDGKPGYLSDIPRTYSYITEVCAKYPDLSEFEQCLQELNITRRLPL